MCQLPEASIPQYIVVFSLDTTTALRHNPRQPLSVQGNSSGELGLDDRPRRTRRYGR